MLGENNSGGQATLDFCKGYATSYKLPMDRTVIDWGSKGGGWETLFTNVDPYVGPNGEFAVPWEAVLDGENMEYVYCSALDPKHNVMKAIFDAMNN